VKRGKVNNAAGGLLLMPTGSRELVRGSDAGKVPGESGPPSRGGGCNKAFKPTPGRPGSRVGASANR
jgi:hypothetical protein